MSTTENTDPRGTTAVPRDARALLCEAMWELNKLSHPPGGCGSGCGFCSGDSILGKAKNAIRKALELLP